MLRDHCDPTNVLNVVSDGRLKMEQELAQLDHLLNDDVLFAKVKADLAKRYTHRLSRGRRATPVAVILLMLIIKHLYAWSFEQTERFVCNSLILRQFCHLG